MRAIEGARLILAALANRVDTRLGYPKDGVDIGGGVHAPSSQSKTTTHADPIKHPTLAKFAYPVDVTNRPHVAAIIAAIRAKVQAGTANVTEKAVDTLPAESDMSADWTPTDVP